DLREAAYPSQWFDAIVLWHVLEHLPDARATIQEVHRLLRPGGLLVVAVPNFSSWQARWAGCDWFHLDLPRHLIHFPVAALKELLAARGFACHSEHHFSLRQNPFGWVQSALNKWGWGSRNGLYVLLHGASSRMAQPISAAQRLWLRAAFLMGMPLGLCLSVLEAGCRQGGTIHVVARAVTAPSK
ncbi:MAG TPA: class I SAM-dependent methyltransferase, partial [Planctomycetaceae bacterium]|nr:class I SAM-dependent methyltransferase [Planctomycetaceae bacterium]